MLASAPPYALSPGVHVAVDKDVAVFLDLRRDRYHSAPAAALRGLGLIDGVDSAPTDPSAPIHATLVEQRLLRATEREPCPNDRKASRSNDLIGVMASCLWARRLIRRKRLDLVQRDLTVRTVLRRREARVAASVLNARFETYRPFFPKARVCLFDSLALAHFLAGRAKPASLIFGVRVRPFAAHCWVEATGAPLNDATGQAASYTPILRIDL